MWLGWVLSVWLITNNDVVIAYDAGQYNYRQECNDAKEDLKDRLNNDIRVYRFDIICKERPQSFDTHAMLIKG